MSDQELKIKVLEWVTEDPAKVSEAIAYLMMSGLDQSEASEIEKEFHKWLNN